MENMIDIPIAHGYWSPFPNGFVVEVKNGLKTCPSVLIASGGQLSTIDKGEAENLGLEIQSAAPLKIIFGYEPDTVSTVSTSVAKFVGSINGVQVCPVDIRVVNKYNVKPVVLAMDWLVEAKVGLMFNPARIYNQQSLAREQRTEPGKRINEKQTEFIED